MIIVNEKSKAAFISILSNSVLIVLKLAVGLFTGSVSIISEAIHSFSDLLASVLAFVSIKFSSEPADTEHPFGHGKFEDLSGFFEGLLIVGAAFYIVNEAVSKLFKTADFHLETTAGIAVMLFSVVVNIIVSRYLFKVGQKTDSITLIADAQHLRTDIYTSAGILLALIIIKITGLVIIDPIIAIIVAALILKTGVILCFEAIKNLLDTSLPNSDRIIINELLKTYIPNDLVEIQTIKTRKAGAQKIIKLTLTVPENMTIKEGHDLCDKIEEDLEKNLGNTEVTIHLEPSSKNKNNSKQS
mgnify:CR=1 FL=1